MLLDTSAWIEFFIQSELGIRTKEILESDECFTSSASVAEIANWSKKENRDTSALIGAVERFSRIIEIDKDIALQAGIITQQRKAVTKKWGITDSFILATAMIYNINILTKDSDFKDLNFAELL